MNKSSLRGGSPLLGRIQRKVDKRYDDEVNRIFLSNAKKQEDYNKSLASRSFLLSRLKEGDSFNMEKIEEPILESFPIKKNTKFLLRF